MTNELRGRSLLRAVVVTGLVGTACGSNETVIDEPSSSADGGSVADAAGLDAEVAPMGNLAEIAAALGLDAVLAAVETASLTESLTGDGPLTVFGPTDAAWRQLDIDDDPALVTNVVLNHLVEGRVTSAELEGSNAFTTRANTRLAAPTLSRSDFAATNGVLHELDSPLDIPRVAEVARAADGLTRFDALVARASTRAQDPLFARRARTVFAPRDDALADVDPARLDIAEADRLLGAHHMVGQVLAADLADGQTLTMADGTQVTVTVARDGVSIADRDGRRVQVVATNIRLSNGVVHVIDGVLSPTDNPATQPDSVLGVAEQLGNQPFVDALEAAGLTALLSSTGPFTLLVPPSEDFDRAQRALAGSRTLLVALILNHVIDGEQRMPALVETSGWTARSGHALVTSRRPPMIAAAEIVEPNIEATNGIVHRVDAVLRLPTVREAIETAPDLTGMRAALDATSQPLQSELFSAPVSVFAPTDPAFDAVDLSSLTPDGVDDLVAGHFVPGFVLGFNLTDGSTLTTVRGTNVVVRRNREQGLGIEGQNGRLAPFQPNGFDLRCLNGVIHRIGAVLDLGP